MDLFLSSHNDDEVLFGSWTIIRHQPHVVVCFKSKKQEQYGVTAETRERETGQGLWWLGCDSWEQGQILDTDPAPEAKLIDGFQRLKARHTPERVWAPFYELGGHEGHNAVAQAAVDVFGEAVQPYLTYVRGSMRSRGREVPFEPSWVSKKLRALACYESQIGLVGNTQPWFTDDTLREYVP